MEVIINEDGCIENGITMIEAIALYAIDMHIFSECQESVLKALAKRKCLKVDSLKYKIPGTKKYAANYSLTPKGKILLTNIIMSSYKVPEELKERLENLAIELKKIFPEGRKPGTMYYWSEGKVLIIRRLITFFKKYGNEYTDDQILDAAKRYVESFNGMYTYMKLLKYFIFKEKLNANGEVEGESELINFIENAGQDNVIENGWASTLR